MSGTKGRAGSDRPASLATSHFHYNAQAACAESGQGPTTPSGQSSSTPPSSLLLNTHHARDAGQARHLVGINSSWRAADRLCVMVTATSELSIHI